MWERVYSSYSFGDCLITVSSSSDVSGEKSENLGLVTGHAYAVLEVVKTKKGIRLLQLKKPWAHKVRVQAVLEFSLVSNDGLSYPTRTRVGKENILRRI